MTKLVEEYDREYKEARQQLEQARQNVKYAEPEFMAAAGIEEAAAIEKMDALMRKWNGKGSDKVVRTKELC